MLSCVHLHKQYRCIDDDTSILSLLGNAMAEEQMLF